MSTPTPNELSKIKRMECQRNTIKSIYEQLNIIIPKEHYDVNPITV